MRPRSAATALVALGIAVCLGLPARADEGPVAISAPLLGAPANQSRGFSIVETGKDRSGRPLFSVRADNADIADVLKAVYGRMADVQFVIREDVRGTINFTLKDATLEQIVDGVKAAAVPPIKVTPGKVLVVSREFDAAAAAARVRARLDGLPVGGSGLSSLQGPLDRQVTLSIPENAPITLAAALLELERQTRVPVRLAKGIPGDIKFTATVTRMPLRFVLDNMAPNTGVGALKWVAMPDHILLAPTDRMQLLLGPNVLGSTLPCGKCRQPVSALWNFCSNCGQLTARGQILQNQSPRRGGKE
jgi:hypothetical protein